MSDEKHPDSSIRNRSSGSFREGGFISSKSADVTLELIEKHGHEAGELTPVKLKTLKRKLFIHVLLLVTFIDFMLYVDKATLGQATLLGLFKDTGLNNAEYNNLNSIFYTGYILGQLPGQLLIQRLQLRTYISGTIFTWALVVCLHCVASSYGGLIPLRFFLGFLEASVIPALEITMSMFFTPQELHYVQPLFYTSCLGSPMFTGLVSYGLLFSKSSISPWKFFMILTGGISLILSGITWVAFPNNPATAWFLTTDEKVHTVQRVHAATRSSIEQKTFKKHQFYEALKDPVSWLFAGSGFTLMLANNLPYQQSLLFLDLGVSPLGSTLVWVASGGFGIVVCIVASILIRVFPGYSAYWAALWCIPCIATSIGMVTIQWGKTIPLLFCLLLPPNCFAQTWIITLGWLSSSCAGHTKRLTRNAMFMVLYGISNIISPQLWTHGGPRYYGAWVTQIVASFTLTPILLLAIRYILVRRNTERRAWIAEQTALGNYGKGVVEEVRGDETVKVEVDVAMMDLTDLENKFFLYPLELKMNGRPPNIESPQRQELSLDEALYNHLALPPQLPHHQDAKVWEIENALIDRLMRSACHMRDLPDSESCATWDAIRRSLQATKTINAVGHVDRTALARELRILAEAHFVMVHVSCQNCALFIHRSHDAVLGDSIVFEAFEVSARNEDVLATENALQWDFPGSAVAVPLPTFLENGFIENLTNFIEHASRESVKDFSALTVKAGATVFEYRNTSEPALVSSMLMAILEENGRRLTPKRLRKMVRDDVCWHNADRPWRRLPYWLALRVSIARYLAHQLGGEKGRVEYKFFLAHVLDGFLDSMQMSPISIDRLDFLKKKLCRRLVKLDADREYSQDPKVADRIDYLFLHLEPGLRASIRRTSAFIEASWRRQKLAMSKSIPLLPRQAALEDLRFDLRVSGVHLNSILEGFTRPRPRTRNYNHHGSANIAMAAKKHLNKFFCAHFDVIEMEVSCMKFCSEQPPLSTVSLCTTASQLLTGYLQTAMPLYENIPELKSTMILNVMDLWVKMDQAACTLHPLLRQFHPVFYPDMLDVLLISQYTDMKRVQNIQAYLQGRIEACGGTKLSILDDPVAGSYGHRAYEESSESSNMKALHHSIERWAERHRASKQMEWKDKTDRFSALSKGVEQSSCVYQVDDNNPLGRGYHDPHCPRCEMVNELSRIKIQAYEHPLPSDAVTAKAVVFELACPETLAVYRQTTWQTVVKLALQWEEESPKPRCLLRDYKQLRGFANNTLSSFSLASTTKSFLTTHYSWMSFPVEWESGRDGVCRPNGLRLAHFDGQSSAWPGRRRSRLSFAHHVKLELPKSSPFSKLVQDASFSETNYGRSSYEIMATATTCPYGVNVHEFLAFQTIASGKSRRWLSILTEVGSANLNFSNEATMPLLNYLTLQCGPRGEQEDGFRLMHGVFRDETFCDKLIQQLLRRLDSLSANWRETCLMETIITFSLRLFDLALAARLFLISTRALALIEQARCICARWFKLLREEGGKVTDSHTAKRYQQYALWAALLCKRTFTVYLTSNETLESAALETFVQSSITVQDNLVVKLESLPQTIRSAVIRDMRMSYALGGLVSNCIITKPDAFRSSLKEIWAEEENCPRTLSKVRLDNSGWITCAAVAGEDAAEQEVWYNHVEGILLINGLPIGKLPEDPNKLVILNELFGNQALLTWPSEKNGMQYKLCVRPCNYDIHVGFGEYGEMIVRAYKFPYTLQLIPRETFRKEESWDLPGPLLDGCFHWLNLNKQNNGELYITKREQPWPNNPFSGFVVNVHQRTCIRQRSYNGRAAQDRVVNTYSPLFNRATRIIESLEYRRHVLVLQPGGNRHIQIELPRLQILFHVNEKNLLQSPQLQCEIDPDQDAGTWYGLLPLGPLKAEAQGCHIIARIEPNGSYGRYMINETLGRLDCAPEPVLVYTKALLHAYTSFLIPDPLTSRTGTEVAIEWLRSGTCHPWTPLSPAAMPILEAIADLTPKRNYYPGDMRVMRTDHWRDDLPVTLQNSEFKPAIKLIIHVSNALQVFQLQGEALPDLPSFGDPHLHTRAILRQQTVERCLVDATDHPPPVNRTYQSRDHHSSSNMRHRNVLEVAHLLRTRPSNLETTTQLAQLLAVGNVIGGFGAAFDKTSLNDRLRANIRYNWGALVESARHAPDKFHLMFLFGLMSFQQDADMSLIRTLIAFGIFQELRDLQLPEWEEYSNYNCGQVPKLDHLLQLLKPFGTPQPEDDRLILEEFSSAKQRRKLQIERSKYELKVEEDVKFFANFLLRQWPCLQPSAENLSSPILLDVGAALEAIRPGWRQLFQNLDLTRHLQSVQEILDQRSSSIRYDPPPYVLSEDIYPSRLRGKEIVDLGQLLLKPLPVQNAVTGLSNGNGALQQPVASHVSPSPGLHGASPHPLSNGLGPLSLSNNQSRRFPVGRTASANSFPTEWELSGPRKELEVITQRLSTSRSAVKRKYAADFQQSLEAYRLLNLTANKPKRALSKRNNELKLRAEEFSRTLQVLRTALNGATAGCSSRKIEWLQAGGMWPAITTAAVLGQLRSTSPQEQFGSGMRETLVDLGVKVTQYQREMRLHNLALKMEAGRYDEEETNEGHSNWDPAERPDWLLLEIESNMMIRPVQIDVALATISPETGSNSVLQMNMGQGKTSCIIPMVAAALADRKRLVRVVVPKALLQQTAQILQSRLGGILGRRLRHVPFSRRTPTTEQVIKGFRALHNDILKTAGIMLCQPEHNMSFMLSGRQRLLDNQADQAGPMIKVQTWLTRVSRDILDESDYTLAVRTQLIYPSGSQMVVDGHPHRWHVAQAVLRLVDNHMFDLPLAFPHSVSVIRRAGGGFPLIYFLRQDVEDELIRRITIDICRGLGGMLPMNTNTLPLADRVAIKDFISAARPRLSSTQKIRKLCPDRPSIRQTVYLLRGLLVNRILMMTLKKRWNVEYGLHPNRDPMAVPFHAKGVPSEQSEWGHPDVAILFTCLAFYYNGVNMDQLRQCLEHILKSDDPSTEYDRWTLSTADFPPSLKAWNSINVDDEMQLAEIWRATRYNGVVIDYLLNNFVFPRHAKQFKVKLQANGWDIPLFQLNGGFDEKKVISRPLTTGFSGTNDNRTMLPLTIQQQDLPSLLHTSAEVLTYLLHLRNRKCVLPRDLRRDSTIGRASEIDLLRGLKERNIRVLIDAGAQVLEMDNLTLAKEWLKIDYQALAALYFDEGNRPWVVSNKGKKTPLLASPYADDLSQCLVYLDEAHTRGTDLRFPPDCRGALTLRLGQTKDHTVQAAMRLRQLGTTQSVTFFIPPEVHQSIADLQGKTMHDSIESADVIEWLLDNTCDGIEQLQPLFYSQGMDFCRRMQAALDHPNFLADKKEREAFVDTIKQEEQQTLQKLYEPKLKTRAVETQRSSNSSLDGFIRELGSRRKTFQDSGRAVHASTLQEVEQEREVAFEVESVKQVKKPHHYPAHSFPGLNANLESFARSGRIPADSHYFVHVFHSLSKTALGRKFKVSPKVTESKLFVTGEFERTAKLSVDLTMDNFIRPVNWVLWSPATETAVVIIPEEADALIPMMRNRRKLMQTHLLIYSAPITRKMLEFNDLTYYSIPPLSPQWKAPEWLRLELGIFAGRLYFDWSEYESTCTLLGIEEGASEEIEAAIAMMDGTADGDLPESLTEEKAPQPDPHKLAQRPLTFMQEWLAIRRRGQDFEHTPMGFVSQGKSLHQGHVFFDQMDKEHTGQNETMFVPMKSQHQDDAGDREDDYQGIDDMGANEVVRGNIRDDHIVYDDSEYHQSTSEESEEESQSEEVTSEFGSSEYDSDLDTDSASESDSESD
ncbi:hypothetical protein G7046_g2016 [Stylonectria norvegica]|nr:hypothetical protein G7046_g2016 [Stylonectria norvegica]